MRLPPWSMTGTLVSFVLSCTEWKSNVTQRPPVGAWPNVQRRCFCDGGVGNARSDADGRRSNGSQAKHSTTQLLWKVILLLIFYNPLFMVMSLFTFSTSLCKCHYSMLSWRQQWQINNKQRRGLKNESLYNTVRGRGTVSHLGTWIDLWPVALFKKKKVNKKRLKSSCVSRIVRPSVWL